MALFYLLGKDCYKRIRYFEVFPEKFMLSALIIFQKLNSFILPPLVSISDTSVLRNNLEDR